MAVDLPGIRARAEFDLQLFKQQEEQIKNALREVANQMRSVPSARIQFDTGSVSAGTEQVKRSVRNMVTDVERDSRRLSQKIRQAEDDVTRSARRAAEDELRRTKQHNAELLRDFDNRLRKRLRQIEEEARAERRRVDQAEKDAKRLAAKQEKETKAGEGRVARAELPIAAGFGAGGFVVTKQLIDATAAAADFEKQFAQVRAVMNPQELAASRDELERLAIALGGEKLGFTATQSAEALEAMTKAGIDAKDQLAGAPAVLALAAAGNTTLAESANFAASSLKAFNLEGRDLERVANVLTGVANATIADINDLRLGFAQSAAVAALHNQTIENNAITLGLLAERGIKASDAGTSLRVMMNRLQPDTLAAQRQMQKWGIIVDGNNKFVDEATGKFKDLREVAEILSVAFQGATQAQTEFALQQIFGQDAVRAAVVLLENGAAGYDRLAEAALNGNTALEVARTRLDSLRGDIINATNAWNGLQIAFGKNIAPNLRPVVQSVTELINSFKNLSPEMHRSIAVIAAVIGGFGSLTGVTLGAVAAWKIAGVVFAKLAISVGAILAPIALVAAAVAALGLAWVNNWGDIQGKTEQAVTAIKQSLSDIGESFGAIGTIIGNAFNVDFDYIIASLGRLAHDAFEIGKLVGENILKAIQEVFLNDPLIKFIADHLGGAARAALDAIEQQRQANRVAAQEAAQAAITPNDVAADLDRIAESFINKAEAIDLGKGLEKAFSEAFANLPNMTEDDILAAFVIWEQQIKDGFTAIFGNAITPDVMDALVKRITDRAQQARTGIAQAGEAHAQAYADPWKQAFKILDLAENDFARALEGAGSNTQVIETLLRMQDAAEVTSKGMRDLADRGLAAALVAQRNLAIQMEDGEEKTNRLIEIGRQYDAHLQAQAKSAQDAADWQKQLNDIAAIGPRLFQDRVQGLISTTLPALTLEQHRQTEELLANGDAWGALSLAVTAAGGDISAIGAIINGTGREVAAANEQLKKLQQFGDPVARAFEITKDRAESFLNTIIQNMPAAQRAQLELVSATQGPLEALRQAWIRLGLDISKLPDIANASARQIQEAQKQLEARQFFLETGELLPASKVQTAGDIFKEASRKAAESIAEARENVRKELEKARQQWSDAVTKAGQALAKAQRDFSAAIADIDAGLEKTLAGIAAAEGEAVASFNKAMAGFARQEAKLVADAQRSRAERARAFQEQQTEASRALAQQLQDISRQISQTIYDATNQQRQSLLQMAQQLSDLRSQETDAARNASVRLEDIALKEFSARTHEEQQELARERIRLQAEQGAAAVELQKQMSRGQNDLRQQAQDREEAMLRAIADAQLQAARAIEEFNNQQEKARQEFERANAEAERQLAEQLAAINEQRKETAAALDKQLRELRKRRAEAIRQAEEAKRKAEEALRDAERQHQEAIAKADQELAQAEQQAAEELAEADRKFQEEMRVANEALSEARRQAGVTGDIYRETRAQTGILEDIRNQRQPFEINMNNMNIEEGDVEFIERAAEIAAELAQQPIG